jgi:serine protease inhibitor
MNSENISDAMGMLDEKIIIEADKVRSNPQIKKKHILPKICAAAACVGIVTVAAVSLTQNNNAVSGNYTVFAAEYPVMYSYPNDNDYIDPVTYEWDYDNWKIDYDNWDSTRRKQTSYNIDYTNGMKNFFVNSARQILSGADDENRVYSPLNVYMALAMLSEVTGGESRGQILSLLGEDNIGTLRSSANSLWNANYCNDGVITSILANSIWLDNSIDYNSETLGVLSDSYYASSFSGEMGSSEYNDLLHNWINEQTGGLLQNQANELEFNDSTVLALASTVYFQGRWDNEFYSGANVIRPFYLSDGSETECEFMNMEERLPYYGGENFSAVSMKMYCGEKCEMELILPNEGVLPNELLSDDEFISYVFDEKYYTANSSYEKVDLTVPKFDVSSDIDLKESLEQLGVTDIFDSSVSDFSPIENEINELYVSTASHSVRVKIDEEGCTAAAVTVVSTNSSAAAPDTEEPIEFVLDRPFIFVIRGLDGLPLFIGEVNNPSE